MTSKIYVASDKIPPELPRPRTDEKELHSYTKLAIAYTGIGLALYILFFGAASTNILYLIGLPSSQSTLATSIPLSLGMIALMIATIYFLKKSRKLGGYLFLAGVTLYHITFIPYPQFLLMTLIPTGIVTALLLASFKHLR